MRIKVVRNWWGWNPKGIKLWFRYGWGWNQVWTIERPPQRCRKFLCFSFITKR